MSTGKQKLYTDPMRAEHAKGVKAKIFV